MSDEPQYVWVVHYDNYGDRWLVGVFDDESLVSKFKPQDAERPWACDYEVVKTRLNPPRTMVDG
jgi:hypothetical protein